MSLIAVSSKRRAALFCALFLLVFALPAAAQMRSGARDMVLIKGARIVTMAGPDLCPGDVLLRKGKIMAVAPSLRAPRGVRVIEAEGKVVIPGLIDANSALLVDAGTAAGASAASTVLDAVNVYRTRDVEAALSQGVTAVALFPPPKSGVAGKGAVLRLQPGVSLEEMILSDELALKACIGIGSYGRPVARLGEIRSFRAALKAASEYRDAFDEYEEELEEYVKKLEERAKKEEKEEKKNGKKGKGETASDKGKEPEKKDAKKGNGKDGKKDELEKPKKPQFNAASQELVRALKGELPLFVEAHRAADIVNVLDVVSAYPVKLVLVGCTEGYLVADEIAESKATVLMGPLVRFAAHENDEYKNHCPWCACVLRHAGVPVVLAGSGRNPGDTRHLALHAAAAAAHGFDEAEALASVTIDAARLLGLDGRIGSIEKGKEADLVILSGDPLSSSTVVETVLIKGKEVYRRSE